MKLDWVVILSTALFFFVAGFLILYDQYSQTGVWFQSSQIQHETLAILFFALAIGVFLGSVIKK